MRAPHTSNWYQLGITGLRFCHDTYTSFDIRVSRKFIYISTHDLLDQLDSRLFVIRELFNSDITQNRRFNS